MAVIETHVGVSWICGWTVVVWGWAAVPFARQQDREVSAPPRATLLLCKTP